MTSIALQRGSGGLAVALVLALSPAALKPALAQDYPTKNVTIVVPLAAGTGMDSIVRIYAEDLGKALGRPIVVENQPGAALMLAAQTVARAVPDGHTLVISTSSPMAVNQTLYKKVNYDPDKDFVPISLYVKSPFVMVVNPALGVNSMAGFIKMGKERKDNPLTYGTPGAGTLLHLTMETMKQDFGFEANHVPYRNSGQIVTDVVGGHISSAVSETGAALALINDGKMKALAITSSVRHPQLPEVAPLAEAANKPGFEAVSWHILLAPSATPAPIVARLQEEMRKITGNPAFQKKVSDIGLIPLAPQTQAEMQAYIKSEQTRWGGVVKKLGLEGSQ
jgi:tripartite-type tricarboxylate transporter receptor subunit TctC